MSNKVHLAITECREMRIPKGKPWAFHFLKKLTWSFLDDARECQNCAFKDNCFYLISTNECPGCILVYTPRSCNKIGLIWNSLGNAILKWATVQIVVLDLVGFSMLRRFKHLGLIWCLLHKTSLKNLAQVSSVF